MTSPPPKESTTPRPPGNKRKAACDGCRAVRRACVLDGTDRCRRCSQQGIDCSFTTHERKITVPRRPAIPYTPSPPSSRSANSDLINFQLSASLTYHLLSLASDLGLRPLSGLLVWGVLEETSDVEANKVFLGSSSNADWLDRAQPRRHVEIETSALVQLLQAARISTHSAIVGSAVPSSTYKDITTYEADQQVPLLGHERRQAIIGLREKIALGLEENARPLDDIDEEADRLIFHYAVHWKCFPLEAPEWHHYESSVIVRRGLALSSRAPEDWAPRDALLRTLQQCVCLHLMTALGHDLPLLIPYKDCMELTPRPPDTYQKEEGLTPADLDAAMVLDDRDADEKRAADNAAYFASIGYLWNTTALSLLTPPFPPSLKTILTAFSAISEVMFSFDRVLDQILDPDADESVAGFSDMVASIQNTGSWQHSFPNVLIGCYRALSRLNSLDFVVRETNLNKFRRTIARAFRRSADYSKYIFSLKLNPADQLDALAPWSAILNNIRDIVSPSDEFRRLDPDRQASLLRMLHFNAFSAHNACQVLEDIQAAGVFDSEEEAPVTPEMKEDLAKEMVETALADVSD